MTTMLDKIWAQDSALPVEQRLLRERPYPVEAIFPNCSNTACTDAELLQNLPPLLASKLLKIHEVLKRKSVEAKKAAVGSWLSHVSALQQFVARSPIGVNTNPQLLLVLEDDVMVSPGFIPRLPCVIATIRATPKLSRFDAVRFSTKGQTVPTDTVRGLKKAFFANRPVNASGDQSTYVGSHAVLYQHKTLEPLLDGLIAAGVEPFDRALRNGGNKKLTSIIWQTALVYEDAQYSRVSRGNDTVAPTSKPPTLQPLLCSNSPSCLPKSKKTAVG